MGELDVRAMMARISYGDLIAWAVYLNVRETPQRPWIRDPGKQQDMAAALYG